METLFTILSTISIVIIFLWAFYHAHVTDVRLKRVSWTFICISTMIVLISIYVPIDETFYTRTFLWQRLFFSLSISFYAVTDFYCEYGTQRFIEAFQNNKKKLIDLTHH